MSKEDHNQHIGHKIRILHNLIDRYFTLGRKEENGVELTRSQCATLRYLNDRTKETVCQTELETAFSVSGATMTNILKIMEKEGLITRIPLKDDARKKSIRLTEKGMEINRRAKENVIRLEEGMKKGFTENEIEQFRSYLERLEQNMEELMDSDPR